jgi:hypothetical protein
MPKEALDFVDKQIEKGYFSSREEFINSATTLLKWAIGVVETGEEVSSYDDVTAVVTPIQFNSKVKPLPKVSDKRPKKKPSLALAVDNSK